jgi:GLPGLI family protein
MKTIIFFFLLGAIHQSLVAQQLEGKAIYKSASSLEFNGNRAGSRMSKLSDMQREEVQKAVEKALRKEYELTFNLKESNWKELESLGGTPSAPGGGFNFQIRTSESLLYKNLQTSTVLEEQDIMGKKFLVTDSLEAFAWQLHDAYKQIGKYTCQKATFTTTQERTLLAMSADEKNETNTRIDTIDYVAWFTPEIPVNHGPAQYWGLPGLILEISNGRRTMICAQLTLNPEEGVEINKPSKGKKVTREEIQSIRKEKLQEMMEQYRGKEGGRRVFIQSGN